MSNFIQDRSGHWYTRDGKPCHTQPDGSKTNLRHARKQRLYPSVTNILSIIPKYTVEDWRVEQAVLATMQCMVQDGAHTLTAQEMMAKVASRLDDATSVGRKFGSEMHSIIEYINNNNELPSGLSPLASLHPEHAAKYKEWLDASGISISGVEVSFSSHVDYYGFGGCLDMTGTRRVPITDRRTQTRDALVDFKTQKVKDGKPRFYPEWSYQLAAYGRGYRDMVSNTRRTVRPIDYISVVIDSETGQIWERHWSEEAINKAYDTFKAAFSLWRAVKDYNPAVGQLVGFDLDCIIAEPNGTPAQTANCSTPTANGGAFFAAFEDIRTTQERAREVQRQEVRAGLRHELIFNEPPVTASTP